MTAQPAVAMPGEIREPRRHVRVLDDDRVAVGAVARRTERLAGQRGQTAKACVVAQRGDRRHVEAEIDEAAEDLRAGARRRPPRAPVARTRRLLPLRDQGGSRADLVAPEHGADVEYLVASEAAERLVRVGERALHADRARP
jgi:hypothetical protein